MIWIVIVFLVVAALSLALAVFDDTADRINYFSLGAVFLFSIIIVIAGLVEFLSPPITPMDVYQGKTTLEYTVVDGVKVDSCVILKK